LVWLKLLFCLVVILFSGTKLARYGDAIAEKTGLGRVWIGMVLIAIVTAMPELVTSISSVALVKIPDLALGTLFGSCLFNLAIIAVLDIIYRASPILSTVSRGHIISAAIGIILMAIGGVTIVIGENLSIISLGWVGIPGIITLVLYLIVTRYMFRSEGKQNKEESPADETSIYNHLSAKRVYIGFALASLTIIGTGIWLSYIGDEIAEVTGWGASFVGSLFLAITTSMPELAVTIAAVRLGAADMAIADILGANMLDVVAVLWNDIFYTQGPILADVSNSHIITSIIVMIMSLMTILGIRFGRKRKILKVFSWYTPLYIGLYIFGSFMLFSEGLGVG
jgi:cation:H+ antiporter